MKENLTLLQRVYIAKDNADERNKLIEEYKPFIASTVQKKVGRYVKYGTDEELSIGLMALNEAIDCFNQEKGNFLTFAKVIINRRLIDYQRKRDNKDIIYSNDLDDNVIELHDRKGLEIYHQDSLNDLRKLEIEEYKLELEQWGLEFSNLVKQSPKQKKNT